MIQARLAAGGSSVVLRGLLADSVRAAVPHAGVCEIELPHFQRPPDEVAEASPVMGIENQLVEALNGCLAL